VVSFITLAYETALMLDDEAFFRKIYSSGVQWVSWLENNRMITKRGLIELFVGHDTGHDGSKRLFGLSCPGNYVLPDGSRANASVLPPNENVAPMLAVDMNCHFYGDLCALSKIAHRLSMTESAKMWDEKAQNIKRELFERCLDKDDMFFYDVDKNNKKRKYRSCTIFHLFMEGVLDAESDRDIIDALYERHINNPDEFRTPYPFPSMAINDKGCEGHETFNCWGYYTQGLIVLRCTRWMDKYGYSEYFDHICRKWVEAWTACYDTFKMGQEIDPITGIPTASSEWYSSCMLMYLYAAGRIKDRDNFKNK
ncbi:MAG: hypothetical protein IKV97_03380, partial [Clostridia bacterium]|nr:hypothetical protein [Clostridia bacterium]